MSRSRPSCPEEELVLAARPFAIRLARTLAGLYHAGSAALVEDCEQVACQALLEAVPGYDKTRGDFEVFAWKRVAGAVTRLLHRELGVKRIGFGDALDETEGFRDASDPFDDTDDDAMAQLKGFCRLITFRRVMGDMRTSLMQNPDDALQRARVFQALEQALGVLDREEKRLIDLRYWQELTWEQVGEAMGMSDRNAKRIDDRLRQRLRQDLGRRGVDAMPSMVQP